MDLRRFDPESTSALLDFNAESVVYCKGISDSAAQEYAFEYARMLLNRKKGLETESPSSPHGIFEPNLRLIRSFLDRMCEKHFPKN